MTIPKRTLWAHVRSRDVPILMRRGCPRLGSGFIFRSRGLRTVVIGLQITHTNHCKDKASHFWSQRKPTRRGRLPCDLPLGWKVGPWLAHRSLCSADPDSLGSSNNASDMPLSFLIKPSRQLSEVPLSGQCEGPSGLVRGPRGS
jgi:hypothetical protein